MKKILFGCVLMIACFVPTTYTRAQIPILDIIKAAVKKAIQEADLQIQRLQNKTIWLQNAQKVVENKMSKLKLNEIRDWVDKQKTLYKDYFDELSKAKNMISTYRKVREIIKRQVQIISEYSKAYALFKSDKNFTGEEIKYMYSVYSGILDESVKNIEQVQMVITAYATQMSDAKRLEIINEASNNMEQNISDLRQFNQENIKTSLQRAKEKNDIDVVKKLYGIN